MVNSYIIPVSYGKALKGQGEIFLALMGLIEEQNSDNFTIKFDTLGKICGYKNRSGAWKSVQKLVEKGILRKIDKRHFKLNLYGIVGDRECNIG